MTRPRKRKKLTAAERVAAYRARCYAQGGKQIAVMLRPKARENLDKLVARGETQTAVINRLIRRLRP